MESAFKNKSQKIKAMAQSVCRASFRRIKMSPAASDCPLHTKLNAFINKALNLWTSRGVSVLPGTEVPSTRGNQPSFRRRNETTSTTVLPRTTSSLSVSLVVGNMPLGVNIIRLLARMGAAYRLPNQSINHIRNAVNT